jgi:hypothetical protein
MMPNIGARSPQRRVVNGMFAGSLLHRIFLKHQKASNWYSYLLLLIPGAASPTLLSNPARKPQA